MLRRYRGAAVSPTLPLVARYTWARQWPAALLEGAAFGVIGLASFAVKRSLGAPEEIVPLLIAFWQVVWIFSPAVGPLLARSDPQRLWRIIAVALRKLRARTILLNSASGIGAPVSWCRANR